MRIQTIYIALLSENCYVLETENSAIVVDPGGVTPALKEAIERIKGKNTLVLLTHCHFDHIAGAEKAAEMLGAKIAIGEQEADALLDDDITLCTRFHLPENKRKADITLADGEEYTVGDITFKVLHTPGHTEGSCCYLFGDVLVSGDTLFEQNVGRTDLKAGDPEKMRNSLARLSKLPDNTRVLSGHGGATTIGQEKQNNVYMKRAMDK